MFSWIINSTPLEVWTLITCVCQHKENTHCFALQLNAFDSRHLDEIYFDVRLTGFQEATRRVKEMTTLDLDYISTIMHNCFHTYEVSRYVIQIHCIK